jgi:hypothetical protein
MLDFPANPNTGDTYAEWTWDGTKWVLSAGAGGGVVFGTAPPDAPSAGTLWWDLNSYQLFIWTGQEWCITVNPMAVIPEPEQPPPVEDDDRMLLQTLTASDSSFLEAPTIFANNPTYDAFDVEVFNILAPNATAAWLQYQVYAGGILQTTPYFVQSAYNVTALQNAANLTYIAFNFNRAGQQVQPGISGRCRAYVPNAGDRPCVHIFGMSSIGASGVAPDFCHGSGYWNSIAAVQGFRLSWSLGNIPSGKCKIYGVT